MQSHGVASSYPIRTSIPNHSAGCFTLCMQTCTHAHTHTHTLTSIGLFLKQLFLTDWLNTVERGKWRKRENKEEGSGQRVLLILKHNCQGENLDIGVSHLAPLGEHVCKAEHGLEEVVKTIWQQFKWKYYDTGSGSAAFKRLRGNTKGVSCT